MSETQRAQAETGKRLDEFLEPLFAQHHRQKCYPGLIFQQGKRKMLQINVPADDLPTLLQAKPSTGNDPDSGKNRPEVKGHAEEIKDYICKRAEKSKPWILGTLTANVDPEKITVTELGRGFCLVIIPRGVKLDITDGQHRKRAVHELIESQKAEIIADNDFPITLVLEEDFNQCQADFRDMAQTRALDKSLLLSFGEFEGKVGITKRLLEYVSMFKNKTERIKNTPDPKKKLIYTTNYIAKMVSCAFSDSANSELKDYDVEGASEILVNCLNQFFTECEETRYISETSIESLTAEKVAHFQEYSLLGRSVGLEILGKLLHSVYDSTNACFSSEKISQVAKLDWSKESSVWEGNVVLSIPGSTSNLGKSAPSYKITASASAVKLAVDKAKVNLGWS
jgi:DNA sulfur modification protein DndB